MAIPENIFVYERYNCIAKAAPAEYPDTVTFLCLSGKYPKNTK